MHDFRYVGNKLFCEGIAVEALARQFGTPLYVYSQHTLTDHFRKLDQAMSSVDHLVCYAVKSNSNLSVLRVLAGLGSGFDIVSGGELRRVLAAGGNPRRCIFAGVGKTEAEIEFGLRQNIYTDPQKPMKVAPGIYPIGGADENSVCCVTVDFALTYFVVSGEIERSRVPAHLLVTDAGGYSVLTAWAAGKLSAVSIAKFIKDNQVEAKVKNRTLIIPGKVAVLQGEIESALPGWKVVVGTNEAIQLVRFLRDFKN